MTANRVGQEGVRTSPVPLALVGDLVGASPTLPSQLSNETCHDSTGQLEGAATGDTEVYRHSSFVSLQGGNRTCFSSLPLGSRSSRVKRKRARGSLSTP